MSGIYAEYVDDEKRLLSFAGFHDPYTHDAHSSGGPQAGPVLTLVREVGFDSVTLLRTPGAHENTDRTENALREFDPGLEVVVEDLALAIRPTTLRSFWNFVAYFVASRKMTT